MCESFQEMLAYTPVPYHLWISTTTYSTFLKMGKEWIISTQENILASIFEFYKSVECNKNINSMLRQRCWWHVRSRSSSSDLS